MTEFIIKKIDNGYLVEYWSENKGQQCAVAFEGWRNVVEWLGSLDERG